MNTRLDEIFEVAKARDAAQGKCVERFKAVVDAEIRTPFREAASKAKASGLFASADIDNGEEHRITLRVALKKEDEEGNSEHRLEYAASMEGEDCRAVLSSSKGASETAAMGGLSSANVESAVCDFFEGILGDSSGGGWSITTIP